MEPAVQGRRFPDMTHALTHTVRALLFIPLALLALAGCETTEGFVTDVENTTTAVYEEVE